MTAKALRVMQNLKSIELPYRPFPKQALFHASSAPYRLLGGAAGPGKSEAVMWEGIIKCLVKPKTNGVLFRKTFPELEMSLIRRFLEKCPRELYTYNSSQHVARFVNDSILQFAYCDNEKDVYKYQSAEFDFIGVDELTHFTEYFFTYILSRLRTTKENVRPSFFAATNPGNIGHFFVKSRWIDKSCKNDGYNPDDYDFISATIKDNPILLARDPDYLKRLENLPEQQKKALLYGSFDVFDGQYFTEFISNIHVIKPFEIPDSWFRFRSIDPSGRSGVTSCKWYALDNDGRVYVYREYYATGRDYDEHAREVARLSVGEMYRYTVIDTAAFAKAGYSETAAEIYERNNVVGLIPAAKERVIGWNAVHTYLRHDEKTKPLLQIFSNCVNVIRLIPLAQHDELKPEDVMSERKEFVDADGRKGFEHGDALDDLRYFLRTLREAKSPDEERKETPVEARIRMMQERSGGFNFDYSRQSE